MRETAEETRFLRRGERGIRFLRVVYLPKKKERKKQARRLAGARAIFVSVLRPTDSPIRATRFITFVAARVLCRIIPGRRSRNLAIFFSLAIYSFVHPKIEIDLELAVNELRKRFPQLPSTLYAYDACTLRVFRSNASIKLLTRQTLRIFAEFPRSNFRKM